MQRFFSTFPGGSPGIGLLLLRGGAAVALFVQGYAYLTDPRQNWGLSAAAVVAALGGALLLVGLLTPVAGLVAALATGALALAGPPSPNASLGGLGPLVVLVASAIALLGPGAFSFDAALFGRREIVIPQRREASPEE